MIFCTKSTKKPFHLIHLYKLIKDKKLTLAQLEEQISKVNSVYEKVHKQADEFNQFTKDYNKEKELLFRK